MTLYKAHKFYRRFRRMIKMWRRHLWMWDAPFWYRFSENLRTFWYVAQSEDNGTTWYTVS